MVKQTKLGMNIKELRRAFGESQQELGNAIGLTSTAIANYENGDRTPDLQKLQLIAAHYGYPVDQLIRDNFSDLQTMSYPTLKKVMEMTNVIFPICCSDKALEDSNFKKGYDYTLKIWDAIKKGDTPMKGMVDVCWESYLKSAEELETIESVANMLALLFVSWSSIPNDYTKRIGEALYNRNISSEAFIKNYVLRKDKSGDKIAEAQKQQFLRDYNESIISCLKTLKDSPEWVELADYYLALRYVIDMTDSNLGMDMNKTIGMEMMLSFLALGNPYAFAFVEKSLEI